MSVAPPTVTHRIGRYEVVGTLATGGMAEIILGRLGGPSGFERIVVVKRILPHLAHDEQFVRMFLDEARIAAQIRHPNVVQVQELTHEQDELYLVMEYLDGESVAGLMRRLTAKKQRLAPALAAHVAAEAAAGLHAAHELRDSEGVPLELVHRDVSPQNLFVTYVGGVKVLDFGIAKAANRLTRTQTGHLKGKYEYMSPEQCAGKALDRRSDVFALGVVLYEMSCGKRLFRRPNQLLVLKAITEHPIVPPSQVVDGYPASLERVVMKALHRRPAERYATAADMRRDLLGVLRELGGDPPEEALAALMQDMFADRIDEKAEMLRRVRSGSDLTHIPVAEADGAVEIPGIAGASEDEVTQDETPSPLAPPIVENPGALPEPATATIVRASRPWLAIGAVAAVVLAVLAVVYAQTRTGAAAEPPAPPPDAPAPSAPLASGPAPAPPSPIAPAPDPAPSTVSIRVESTPSGATVRIGEVTQGETPLAIELPRGDTPVTLVLEADGYAAHEETVVPDVAQRLRLALVRDRSPRPRVRKRAPDGTGFHRFD